MSNLRPETIVARQRTEDQWRAMYARHKMNITLQPFLYEDRDQLVESLARQITTKQRLAETLGRWQDLVSIALGLDDGHRLDTQETETVLMAWASEQRLRREPERRTLAEIMDANEALAAHFPDGFPIDPTAYI